MKMVYVLSSWITPTAAGRDKAKDWLKPLLKHVEEKYPDVKMEQLRTIAGGRPGNELLILSQFKSQVAWAEFWEESFGKTEEEQAFFKEAPWDSFKDGITSMYAS